MTTGLQASWVPMRPSPGCMWLAGYRVFQSVSWRQAFLSPNGELCKCGESVQEICSKRMSAGVVFAIRNFQGVLSAQSLRLRRRESARRRERIPGSLHAWHGAWCRAWSHDLSWNQESDAQSTEPPRCSLSVTFSKNIGLLGNHAYYTFFCCCS